MAEISYSPQVVDHFTNPRNPGVLPDATGRGRAGGGSSGEILVQISVRSEDGVIAESRFRAFGCSATIAAASVTTELLRGRRLEDALCLEPGEVEEALGGLPGDRHYCAEYAAEAARAAARDDLSRHGR